MKRCGCEGKEEKVRGKERCERELAGDGWRERKGNRREGIADE